MSDLIKRIPEGYTPGPWHVSGVRFRMNGGEWQSVGRYDEAKKQDENIAAVGYDPRSGLGFADARLIALAPELVAEVRRLTAELEKANNEFGSQTADWPDLWKRIADLKELSNEGYVPARPAECYDVQPSQVEIIGPDLGGWNQVIGVEAQPSQADGERCPTCGWATHVSEPRPFGAEPAQPSQAQQAGDWPEDFSHENGNYLCTCSQCGYLFTGHKRRTVCKLCASQAQAGVTEADKALIWYASQPAEHASVDEWADWYRAEPASRSRVVEAARERAALSARQGEGAPDGN